MYWRLASFLGLSLVNPVCMAISFCSCLAMDIYQPTSSNVVTFDARFFPVYWGLGIIALAAQFALIYGVLHLVYRERMTVAKVMPAFLSAQKPFYFLAPALILLLGDVEGNVLVFGIIFTFPGFAVAGVLALERLVKRVKGHGKRTVRPQPCLLDATVAVAALMLVRARLLSRPNSGSGRWLYRT